jgi:amino acid transporter
MTTSGSTEPHLVRRFGLLQATALNMINMIGIGPFITVPLLMTALGGPQALFGWILALAIVICDGLVWAELGASMPVSGGSFGYLRLAFGPQRFGRLMGFLFVWQFIVSGPFEIASGYIGFAQYTRYIWPSVMPGAPQFAIAAAVGILNVVLLYRRINSLGAITVTLWVGTIVTSLGIVASGGLHFDPRIAFDFPPGAFKFSLGFLIGLGTAARIGVYDYLGYYDVCYIGGEVKDPGRVIPRSIIFSTVAVGLLYIAINLSIIGVVPWREFVPAGINPNSDFVVSIFMERLYGSTVASVVTLMILWTAFGSVFALLLGYSRIPWAAAREGYFFKVFGKLHPQHAFPHVALLVLGGLSILFSFLSLGAVIDALIATRILVQFIGQIVAVVLMRQQAPDTSRPFRIWLYPLPLIIAFAGWLLVFVTSPLMVILLSFVALALGVLSFGVWSYWLRQWPFGSEG